MSSLSLLVLSPIVEDKSILPALNKPLRFMLFKRGDCVVGDWFYFPYSQSPAFLKRLNDKYEYGIVFMMTLREILMEMCGSKH